MEKGIVLAIGKSVKRYYFTVCSEVTGPLIRVYPGETYSLRLSGNEMDHKLAVYNGDVVILLDYKSDSKTEMKRFKVLRSRELSVYWMIPQYLLMGLSTVIFILALFIFQYNETPPSSTAFVWSLKHFKIGFDSILLVGSLLISQSLLFLYTTYSAVNVVIFALMVRNYKYSSVDPSRPANNRKSTILPLSTIKGPSRYALFNNNINIKQ